MLKVWAIVLTFLYSSFKAINAYGYLHLGDTSYLVYYSSWHFTWLAFSKIPLYFQTCQSIQLFISKLYLCILKNFSPLRVLHTQESEKRVTNTVINYCSVWKVNITKTKLLPIATLLAQNLDTRPKTGIHMSEDYNNQSTRKVHKNQNINKQERQQKAYQLHCKIETDVKLQRRHKVDSACGD